MLGTLFKLLLRFKAFVLNPASFAGGCPPIRVVAPLPIARQRPISDKGLEAIAAKLAEGNRLIYMSNQKLVEKALYNVGAKLSLDGEDAEVFEEMCSRIDPLWAERSFR